MKMFKNIKCLIGAMLLGATLSASAVQSVTIVNFPAGMTNVLQMSNSVTYITQIVATSTNATQGLIYLYDSPVITNTYVSQQYTNIVWTNGVFTQIYTNFLNQLNTSSYLASVASTNTVLAATNTYPLNYAFSAQPTNSTTITSSGIRFGSGLLVSNNVPITLTITYQKYDN